MTVLTELVTPSLLLSVLLALLWATLWFAWQGGGWRGWVIDVLAALLGFAAGQLLGTLLRTPLPAVGEVHAVEGTLGSWLVLWLANRWRRR